MTWTSEKARALTDRILSFSKAKECELSLRFSEDGHTRFAANDITTSGSSRTVARSVCRSNPTSAAVRRLPMTP